MVQVTSGRINTREQIGCACLTLIDPSGKSLPLAATQSLLAWCSARNRSRALRMVAPHWLADGRCVPPNWRAPQVEALVYLAGNSLHLYVRFAPNAASFTCLARFHAHAPYEPHARCKIGDLVAFKQCVLNPQITQSCSAETRPRRPFMLTRPSSTPSPPIRQPAANAFSSNLGTISAQSRVADSGFLSVLA